MKTGKINLQGQINGENIDTIEQNIYLNAYRIAVNGALANFNMVNGVVDEFEDESGVDTANSTNEDYDATNDLYRPTGLGSENLIAHWKMNDNAATTNVAEAVGTIGDGTAQQNTDQLASIGKINGALSFNGSSDYIDTNETTAFNFGTGDFSIAFWMKADNWTGSQAPISNSLYDSGWDGTHFEHATDEKIHFQIANTQITSTTVLSNGNWYHVVGLRSSGVGYIYINGGSYEANASATSDVNAGRNLFIGKNNDATYPRYFDGLLDDIRVYDRALTETEIGLLYNSGDGIEDSSIIDNMTLISNSTTAEAQPDTIKGLVVYKPIDSVTLNTDLKLYFTRDDGTTWTQATLSSVGNLDNGKVMLVGEADVSSQPSGTSLGYKIVTDNNKDMEIHSMEYWYD